eukprot:2724881-Rhodomonas_salina.11
MASAATRSSQPRATSARSASGTTRMRLAMSGTGTAYRCCPLRRTTSGTGLAHPPTHMLCDVRY